MKFNFLGYPLPAPRFSLVEAEPVRKSDDMDAEAEAEADEEKPEEDAEGEEEIGEEEEEGKEEAEEGEVGEKEAEEVPEAAQMPTSGKKHKLINQFNFCERAALTFTNPKRVFIWPELFFFNTFLSLNFVNSLLIPKLYRHPVHNTVLMSCNGISMTVTWRISKSKRKRTKKMTKRHITKAIVKRINKIIALSRQPK